MTAPLRPCCFLPVAPAGLLASSMVACLGASGAAVGTLIYLCHLLLRRLCCASAAAVPLLLLLLGPEDAPAADGTPTAAATADCPLAGLPPAAGPPAAAPPEQAGLRHVRLPRAAAVTAVRCRLFPRLLFLYTSSSCCPPPAALLNTATVPPPLPAAGGALLPTGMGACVAGSRAAAADAVAARGAAARGAAGGRAGGMPGLVAAAAAWSAASHGCCCCCCCCCCCRCCTVAVAPGLVHVLLRCCCWAPKDAAGRRSVAGDAGWAEGGRCGGANTALPVMLEPAGAVWCCAAPVRVHVLLRFRGCCCCCCGRAAAVGASRPAAGPARPAAAAFKGAFAWLRCGCCTCCCAPRCLIWSSGGPGARTSLLGAARSNGGCWGAWSCLLRLIGRCRVSHRAHEVSLRTAAAAAPAHQSGGDL